MIIIITIITTTTITIPTMKTTIIYDAENYINVSHWH